MSGQLRPLGSSGKVLSINDLHLLGKLLEQADDAYLDELGCTEDEKKRADHLYEALDAHLAAYFGDDWHDKEVL